jgi:ribosome maturation factor RimP
MTLNELKEKLEDLATVHDIWIEDVRMSDPSGGTLVVLCDKKDGIRFSDIQAFSKEILKLDWYDQHFSDRFDLEVSSPGLDFPLTLPRHFLKNKGRLVKIHHSDESVPSPIIAEIVDVIRETVILRKEKELSGREIHLPLDQIVKAKIQIKW